MPFFPQGEQYAQLRRELKILWFVIVPCFLLVLFFVGLYRPRPREVRA